MSNIGKSGLDWDEALDGATHICYQNFYRLDEEGIWWYGRYGGCSGWKLSGVTKDPDFKPISKEEDLNMNKQFTKADLKDGMVVTLRDGTKHEVSEQERCIGTHYLTEYFNEDLTRNLKFGDVSEDIMKVEQPNPVVVFERIEQTPEQKQIAELKATIEQATAQIKALEEMNK